MIIPTDELIFFRGVGQPPTSRKSIGSPAEEEAADQRICNWNAFGNAFSAWWMFLN